MQPGRYLYDIEGTADTSLGQFPYASTSVSTYHEPHAGEQVVRTHRRRDDDGDPDRFLEQTLRQTDDRIELVAQRTADDDPDASFHPAAPLTLFHLSTSAGPWAWTATSDSGAVTIAYEARVVRSEPCPGTGTAVSCLVVASTTTFTTEDGYLTQERTTWLSPAHRLVVREETTSQGEGSVNGAPVSGTAQDVRTIRSLEPDASR